MANLLEWLQAKAAMKDNPRKQDISEIMKEGTPEEKEELWKKITEAGGYEALED